MLCDRPMFLIAEYCAGPFYMGWWLYLRDSMGRQQRNADGDWGWIGNGHLSSLRNALHQIFETLGIPDQIVGGTGDDGAIAKFAHAHRMQRQRIGGRPRGCVQVFVDYYGRPFLASHLRPVALEVA